MGSSKGIFLTGVMVGAIVCFLSVVIAYNIVMVDAVIVSKEMLDFMQCK